MHSIEFRGKGLQKMEKTKIMILVDLILKKVEVKKWKNTNENREIWCFKKGFGSVDIQQLDTCLLKNELAFLVLLVMLNSSQLR